MWFKFSVINFNTLVSWDDKFIFSCRSTKSSRHLARCLNPECLLHSFSFMFYGGGISTKGMLFEMALLKYKCIWVSIKMLMICKLSCVCDSHPNIWSSLIVPQYCRWTLSWILTSSSIPSKDIITLVSWLSEVDERSIWQSIRNAPTGIDLMQIK